jgi:hypothetical protein
MVGSWWGPRGIGLGGGAEDWRWLVGYVSLEVWYVVEKHEILGAHGGMDACSLGKIIGLILRIAKEKIVDLERRFEFNNHRAEGSLERIIFTRWFARVTGLKVAQRLLSASGCHTKSLPLSVYLSSDGNGLSQDKIIGLGWHGRTSALDDSGRRGPAMIKTKASVESW